jgi:hypothetical protein
MEPRKASSHSTLSTPSFVRSWFKALDKRRIGPVGKRRIALVVGIHSDRSDLWIQVMQAGDPTRTLVLHVSDQTTIDEAVAALNDSWFGDHRDRSVVDLSRAA